MTVLPNMDAVPTHAADWDSIDWDQAHRAVKRLQVRIAKAHFKYLFPAGAHKTSA